MMNRFIECVIKQRILILLILCGLCVWGIASFYTVPIDAFPDVTNNQVQILSSAEGYSPLEMEKLVTYPIEIEMSSLPFLVEKRSISQFGLSSVTLVFVEDIDLYWIRNIVMERLISVKGDLPEGVVSEMGPVSTGLGEIYQYSLSSDSLTLMELRTLQDWIIAPQLREAKGVIEVNSFGGEVKQYHVLLDQAKMFHFNVTLEDVYEAVRKNNKNSGGNFIEKHSEQFVIRTMGMYQTEDDIRNTVVKLNAEVPVYVGSVARIVPRPQVRYGAATQNAEGETVVGIVMMLKGESGRDVVRNVEEKMEQIKSQLPSSVTVDVYYNRIELVNAAVKTMSDALFWGVLFVIAVLCIFLRALRPSFIVALVLPFSIFISFICMKLFGISANLMSLGGLAIGIGMMVDGSIVVVENILRHLKEGNEKPLMKTIVLATKEVSSPSAFAVGIIIAVFLPLLSLEGLEGKMFAPLALTISIALLASLILALSMAPVLSSFLLKSYNEVKPVVFIQKLENIYTRQLIFLHKNQGKFWTGSICLLSVCLFLFTRTGREFIPTLEEGAIAVQAFRLPSISLTESIQNSKHIESRILKTPEVINVVSRTGRAEVANDPMLPSISDIYVMLKPLNQWREGYTKERIVDEMRQNLAEIPGVTFSITQPIALRVDELISGVKSQLAVKIYGENMRVLEENAAKVASVLGKLKGAKDVKIEQTTGFGYVQMKLNRTQMARYGLSVDDVQKYISIGIGGVSATTLYEGERMIDVVVRYDETERSTIHNLKQIRIHTPTGDILPLSVFADIYLEEGPAQISRERGKRRITVELNIKDVDIASFVEEAQAKIDQMVSLPSGYFLEWGGQFENQQRSMKRLSVIIPITLVCIGVLLFISMGNISQALLVFLNIPFSLTGGIIGLWVSGFYLSVPASVGFIAIIGTAVQNGIVLISFIKSKQDDTLASIVEGAKQRLRPILMTACTTFVGLVPLLFATGIGSEIQRPLAVVVVGGLFTSVVSTLFVLPLLYKKFIQTP